LAALIKSKKVSAKEAATAALARLDAVNPKLNAVVDHKPAEVLAEAAAAAGIPLDACLQAARDPARDAQLEHVARRLLAAGADRLPVVRVGRVLYCGEQGVAQAAAVRRAPARRGAGVA
jgi:hypothetical protein